MKVYHIRNKKKYIFSNDNLQVGNEVFPIASGWTRNNEFILEKFDYRDFMSGFPDEPHIIKDLCHSDYKPYQIHTSHGYGPIESYYKIIEIIDLNTKETLWQEKHN